MKITQIRNATLRLDFGGVRFLVDPFFAPKGSFPGLPGTPNDHLMNPLVDLPFPAKDLVDVDAVIVTHLHPDHWDDAAKAIVPKSLTLFAQNADDAAAISADGFKDVRVLGEASQFEGVTMTKTGGLHGSPEIYKAVDLGKVSGVVFTHPAEPKLYIAGDTVWNDEVNNVLATRQPDIIALNAGFAQITGLGAILMGTEDVLAVSRAAPQARLISSHMEAMNHCILSRSELRDFAEAQGFSHRLSIPADGETMTF